ncbi:MAG: Asp/Glu/hydantoin racemase [Anaerolineae bacterium]|nr:Asp/Glu/hydantoin racemase [Anaerolineae bacterium]
MAKTLAMIHTVAGIVPSFAALAGELLPHISVFHLVDEGLLSRIIAEGRVTSTMCLRVVELAANAQADGANAILLTCSAMSPAVDLAAPLLDIPMLKVDEPMVDRALQVGSRIGVFATVAATLQSVGDLVRQRAQALGRPVKVVASLQADAMAAAREGRQDEHDRAVRAAVARLAAQSDVIVMAQASAAQALLAEDLRALPVPVLTSPRLALSRVRQLLTGEPGEPD